MTKPPTAIEALRDYVDRQPDDLSQPVGPDVAYALPAPLQPGTEIILDRITARLESSTRAIQRLEEFNRQYRLAEHLAHYKPTPEWRAYLAEGDRPLPRPLPDLPWMRNSLARPHP